MNSSSARNGDQIFVSPESRHGRLLLMNEKALPPILLELRNEKTSPRDRAFLFMLIHSILPERNLDPTTREGVMPGFSRRFPGGHCWSSGNLDPSNLEPQLLLADEWLAFARRYICSKRIEE